ncbi:hypothetical protein BDZ94DRAFT_193477 [Collybia nuda]|uniref:Uncharacterized protein n=1 Tax=Collybia nuda TaxID=64659 RepID=A0A9P5XW26_9AGAR|nr:hypothetical protein BDZ94DRAFT_193477 [Collybia nuda]
MFGFPKFLHYSLILLPAVSNMSMTPCHLQSPNRPQMNRQRGKSGLNITISSPCLCFVDINFNPSSKDLQRTQEGGKRISPLYDPNSEMVNIYDTSPRKLDALPLGGVYGTQNIYQDVSAKDVMELEKSLSKLENYGARVMADLHKASSREFTLIRKDLNYLHQFCFIMHYR